MEVCGADGERELARQVRANACVDRAIAQAVAAVNAPALTGLYQNKIGGRTQLASIHSVLGAAIAPSASSTAGSSHSTWYISQVE